MSPEIAEYVSIFLALILSLSIHEAAHAWSAKLQGDDTAERLGRLTINPIPHIDPIGTILLPGAMLFMGGGFFGWAKPVPVDLRNIRNEKWGHAIVAAAGPAANIALCVSFIFLIKLYETSLFQYMPRGSFFYPLVTLSVNMVKVNALLAVFNMIPIPPLDGGTVMAAFLPDGMKAIYQDYLEPYGSFILLLLIFSGALRFISPVMYAVIDVSQSIVGVFF